VERFNIASYRRRDHMGDPTEPLSDSVRALVRERLGRTPSGPIRLLTHLRYFGYVMNPISLYYCFEAEGGRLDAIVAEVNNTPWGEQHCYVIDARDVATEAIIRAEHEKAMHVSPFLPMAMHYIWQLSPPRERLSVHIEDFEQDELLLDALLQLERRPITSGSLARVLLRHPFITLKVTAAIYWQAVKLWWRGVPFVPHPRDVSSKHKNS